MNIVIFGANGGVGRCLVDQALEAGHRVTAAVRRPSALAVTHPNLRIVACDVREPQPVRQAVEGQDVVFAALGDPSRGPTTLYSTGAKNIVEAMQAHGVRRLVFLSNFGVLNERATGFASAILLMLLKRVIPHTLSDHRLALDAIKRGAREWVVVRPMSMTHGPRVRRYRVVRDGLPPRGTKISRADVADFMLKQATSPDYLNTVPAIAY